MIKFDKGNKTLNVRHVRKFAPNLTTTMHHPVQISRHAVSASGVVTAPNSDEVTISLKGLSQITNLTAGSKIVLTVDEVIPSNNDSI